MIGAVGADDPYYSTLVKPTLEESGVVTEFIAEKRGSQTGSATIIVEGGEAGGENRILVVPGANHSGMSEVETILSKIEGQHPPCGVVVMQGEIPRPTVVGILQHLNSAACGTHVIFNPAPVFPDGVPLAALASTAVLVVNETEAMQISRSVSYNASPIGTVSDLQPEDLARHMHQMAKINIVLITLGAKGVFFSTITGTRGRVPGVAVKKVVDTTAAGDTFVGYFAAAFARFVATEASIGGFDGVIEKVVRDANAAAAVCVQRSGAMQSIPFAYEL
jgi:ribokinase